MIKPLNGHLLIEPVKVEGTFHNSAQLFHEKGTVIDPGTSDVPAGSMVYFDSWSAAKYERENTFFWLVPYDHIRAIESNDGKDA